MTAKNNIKDKAAIIGIGETNYNRESGRSELEMAVEAAEKAIVDAGLKSSVIDGISVSYTHLTVPTICSV